MNQGKRNIIDIRPPRKKTERQFFARSTAQEVTLPQTAPKKKLHPFVKRACIFVAVFLGFSIGITAVGFVDISRSAKNAIPIIKDSFVTAHDALEQLETKKAAYAFKGAKKEIQGLENKADRYGISALAALFSTTIPSLQRIPALFSSAINITESLITITSSIESLSQNAFAWLMQQNGKQVAMELASIYEQLGVITEANAMLKNESAAFGYAWGGETLSANVALYRTERFLKSILTWFTDLRTKHIAILFANPTEMRPGGGFLGSYGDLTMTPDGIQEIKVWDVYDPDGQLDVPYAPPKELRSITPRWGARDANWFFDFPLSAEKTISLLEQSKIYKEQSRVFDGVIAININVLASLLEITGPITLDAYKLAITKQNFLKEIQREVESGADNKAGEPKRILKQLAPKLLQALGALDTEGKRMLLQRLSSHITSKDIMLYMRDLEMENYLTDIGVAGEVAAFPEGGNADYLAIVSANVGGGKSDAFLKQRAKLSTKIDADGRISNFLTIERTHSGQNEPEWWYRSTNKSFMKIFTAPGSRLTYMKGGETKTIAPLSKASLLIDPDLENIEKTAESLPHFKAELLEESGKTVFSTWMNVPAGASKKLELSYTNPNRITLGGEPIPYTFIFDKQSGSDTSLDVLLEAPPGYLWQENGGPVFNYITESLPRRVSLDLTLVKDPVAAEQKP